MRRVLIVLMATSVVAAGFLIACETRTGNGARPDRSDTPGDDDDDGVAAPDGGGPAPTGPAATGLPCDVQTFLENRCIVCHGAGAALGALVTYDDLKKPSRDPSKTMAQASLERMKAKTMPPAPAQPPFDDEVADLEAWIKEGLPMKPSCGGGTTAPRDAGPPPEAGCTSGKTWNGEEGRSMRPGEPCIACHTLRDGPRFRFAGTIYPTIYEPDKCNGAPPPITVTITDSTGAVEAMEVNGVGNFMSERRLTAPFKVALSSPKGTRAMASTITGGDCNGCHTQFGDAGAPGRILAP